MNSRSLRVCSLVLLMLVVLAACGQKPGVHVTGFVGPGGVATTGPDGTGPGGTGPGGTSTTGPGGNSTGPGGVATSGPGAPGPGGPGDRTGISGTEIKIGVHAPLTGAAPISPEAFRAGAPVYWKNHKVHGRKVTVFVEDDNYRAQAANVVCNKMAVENKVFLLIGAAGADQIKTCAKYSSDKGIPYFSAGVHETKFSSYSTYSALTMTYADQMPLFAQYIKSLGDTANKYGTPASANVPKDGAIKIMFVRPDSSNFDDAEDAFKAAIKSLGSKYQPFVRIVKKEGEADDASAVGQAAIQNGIDILSPITAPGFSAVALAGYTGSQSYFPLYAGVGVTNGVNQALGRGARACDRDQWKDAMFFSPWPAWNDRNSFQLGKQFDAEMRADASASRYNTATNGGDILMAIYGIMADIDRILTSAGPNLTRQSLVAMMKSFSTKTGFFPDLQFSSGNPFGARGVHALVADCTRREFLESKRFFGLRTSFA